MLIPKQEIIRDEKYRRWIASLPCIITGRDDVQAAHLRHNSNAGLGRKPSDERCLPLSCDEHKRQHATTELKYYYNRGGVERAVVLAKALYENRFDDDKAHELIREWRETWTKDTR